jgi:glycosyltransferase involved in cell wall biosynthesis
MQSRVKPLSIFIFKSNARGMQYGMGTYIRELTESLLSYTNSNVYVVTYHNSDYKEFTTEIISPRFRKIHIPSPKLFSDKGNIYEKKYASTIINMLFNVIPKNDDVVFQINFVDGLPIVKKLKEMYQYPVISVVHFANWQQLFLGNKKKLNGLNLDTPTNNIEFTIFNEKELYQLSDHIVSVTSYMKDFLVEKYDIAPAKIDIIPNGFSYNGHQTISKEEKSKLKRNLGFGPYEKIILFSGRLDRDKGVNFLLDAFAETCKYMDDLRLVFIGEGNISECLLRCKSLYGKITFTGFVPADKVVSFYQIADVGIVPSIYDHCPYSVLEMMAYKVPLILSRIDGLDEIYGEGQCIFIDPLVSEDGEITFNIKDISNAIISLIRDENIAKKLALKAFEDNFSKFSVLNMALEMEKIYLSFFEGRDPMQGKAIKN